VNFLEAKGLVTRIGKLNCQGNPLAAFDDRQAETHGSAWKPPRDQDPGIVMCRVNGLSCIFGGGDNCPKGFKGTELDLL
jgi:hypothetical protein